MTERRQSLSVARRGQSPSTRSVAMLRRLLRATAGLTGLALAVLARPAVAATADGTLVTNVATATFGTASTPGFAVSYGASAYVLVANPCVALQKVANVTVQSSGGTVTYTLWVVNCSPTTSAFNITVVDRLPDNVAYDAARGSWAGLSGGTWYPSTSPNGLAPWAAGNPASGQTTPFYMRYVLDTLGPTKSALLSYSVVIL